MLVTVPATFAKNWGRFVQSNYNPNFHFAPCVLVDELENVMVTLENWVSENQIAITERKEMKHILPSTLFIDIYIYQ